MSAEMRQLLLHAMLLLLLSLEGYTAYSRILIMRMASHLRIPLRLVCEDEVRLAKSLSRAIDGCYDEGGLVKKADENKASRRGRGGGGGIAFISAPAELAAPLKAAKVGSLDGIRDSIGFGFSAAHSVLGHVGTLADGGLATCILFGLCGLRGAAVKPLDAYTKDVQEVSLLPLHSDQADAILESRSVHPDSRRLRLSIGISGWLSLDENASTYWRVLGDKSEAYALNWESETMTKMGATLQTATTSLAWQVAKKEFSNRNDRSGLAEFQWPPGLLKISKIVDNPWSVGMVRADKVGMALADAIVNKFQGERSITLLGYGLGARIIYTCLLSLAERRVFGLVENVILMGAPVPSSQCVWTALRSVVVGRVVNVFSKEDCMLGFLHRTSCVQLGIAGLQRIEKVYGIENVDAAKPLTSHLRYPQLVGRILKDIGWEDLDLAEIAKSEEALAASEKEKKKKNENENESVNVDAPKETVPAGERGSRGKKRGARRRLETQMKALQISN